MSRTRRSAWNFAAAVVLALASGASAFFATPWLLYWLGSERLGAYWALTDWIGYLSLLELGLGGALMTAFAARAGRDDGPAVARMVAAGMRAYSRVALLQCAGGIALLVVLPQMIALDQVSPGELRIAAAVALLSIALTPLLAFRALAESRQRGYLNSLLLAQQALVMTGLALVAAYSGLGLIGQTGALAVAQVPTLLVLAWDGARAYRGVWKVTPTPSDRRVLWRLSWPTFMHGLTDRVGLVSDNVVVAWILGPAAVVPFYMTQLLAMLIQSKLRGFGHATWAGLAEVYARGDHAGLRVRLVQLTGLVSGLGMAMLTPVAAYNRAFVHLWVGREVYAGEVVTVLACLNALLWAVFTIWGWALLGSGQLGTWVPFGVLSAIVNIVVSVVGTTALGLVGPLLGTSAALLFVTSWALPRALHRAFGVLPWTLWRAVLAPLRWAVAFAIVMWAVAAYHSPRSWLEFVAIVGPSVVGGLALWWRVSLRAEERAEWRARLQHVLLGR
jgi:O-antigen/teichoic acid export membrane protein